MIYKTIKTDGVAEEEIKKSRFLCYLKRVESEEEGRDFIAQIKKEHYKANHLCSAMIIGENSEIKRSSDDGEPSGTAGIPMLNVLEKLNLTNVVAVVTRYFGGIKLGTGGLIRAYSGSVANACKEVGIVEVKELQGIRITLTYQQYQSFSNFLSENNLKEFETEFLENILTNIYIDPEKIEIILNRLVDFFNGKVGYEKIDMKLVEVTL